jgi:transcriptional regulator with XRE-family HTH domain
MNVEEYFAAREARDPEFRAAWESLRPTYEFQRALIAARLAAGLSQRELAARLGTKQPAIARLESGQHPPRLSTLQHLADALGITFVIRPHAPLKVQPAAEAPRHDVRGATSPPHSHRSPRRVRTPVRG